MRPILARAAAIIGGLLVAGLFIHLLSSILRQILPSGLMQALTDGWNTLMGLVGPALGPVAAAGILASFLFIIIGKRR
jgi:hypothetical protein